MEIINVTGKPCPIPVIEAKKALRKIGIGEDIKILVDNDISRQNLEKMARGMAYPSSHEKQADGNILVSIKKTEGQTKADTDNTTLVVIGKNTMGAGNDDLGATLLKAFIYSLTELDTPPASIIFFNSGVFLTTEGSNAISDLKNLESKGTVISSCGACLDFYDLKEKLAVGNVTNMYAIATAMCNVGTVVNL